MVCAKIEIHSYGFMMVLIVASRHTVAIRPWGLLAQQLLNRGLAMITRRPGVV
jgi:hypothetical protein